MSETRESRLKGIGAPKKHNGKAIVAFLDILGFSEKIKKHWDLPEQEPLKCILRLKKKTNNRPQSVSQTYDLSRAGESYSCRVQALSDHFIVSCAFQNENDDHAIFWSIVCLIENCHNIWANAINNGYTLRGGIEYGAIYWDKSDIIGPALIDAYNLENKIARTSRVIIGSNLNSMLKDLLNRYKELNSRKALLQLFVRDTDGYIILDPSELQINNVRVENVCALRDKATQTEHKYKYTGMITYMEQDLCSKKGINLTDFGGY